MRVLLSVAVLWIVGMLVMIGNQLYMGTHNPLPTCGPLINIVHVQDENDPGQEVTNDVS